MATNFHKFYHWTKVNWSCWWTLLPGASSSTLTFTQYFINNDSARSHSPIAVYIPSAMRQFIQLQRGLWVVHARANTACGWNCHSFMQKTFNLYRNISHLSVTLVMNLKKTAICDILNYGDMHDRQMQWELQFNKDLKLDYSSLSYPTDCQNQLDSLEKMMLIF